MLIAARSEDEDHAHQRVTIRALSLCRTHHGLHPVGPKACQTRKRLVRTRLVRQTLARRSSTRQSAVPCWLPPNHQALVLGYPRPHGLAGHLQNTASFGLVPRIQGNVDDVLILEDRRHLLATRIRRSPSFQHAPTTLQYDSMQSSAEKTTRNGSSPATQRHLGRGQMSWRHPGGP